LIGKARVLFESFGSPPKMESECLNECYLMVTIIALTMGEIEDENHKLVHIFAGAACKLRRTNRKHSGH